MTIKILEAVEYSTEYYFKVHIDDTQVDAGGNPDPAYVDEFRWGKDQDIEVSKREMRLLCEAKLVQINGTPMEETGQPL